MYESQRIVRVSANLASGLGLRLCRRQDIIKMSYSGAAKILLKCLTVPLSRYSYG